MSNYIACCILYNYVLFGVVPLNEQDFSPEIPNLHEDVVGDAVGKFSKFQICGKRNWCQSGGPGNC